MNLNIEIGYEQLLYLVKQLPLVQRKKLVEAIQSSEPTPDAKPNDLQRFLLTGPVQKAENQQTTKPREQFNQSIVEEPGTDYPLTNMEAAAKLLLNDYLYDEELTAFTTLDSEELYETR